MAVSRADSAGPTRNSDDPLIRDPSRDYLRRTWGIEPGYWLWPAPIRILFVVDGRVDLTSDAFNFGLGYVIDTLLEPVSWWVRFEVHIAKRDGILEAESLGSHYLSYTDFRFTDAGFNLNDYHQVWFFGDNPSDATGPVTDNDIPGGSPLDDAELKLLAEWMDRGGGVFAAGDHSILGASMCSRIPRVRTMRKWTQEQGVPTKTGPRRHRTLQPTIDNEDNQEQDTVLQPLEVVYTTRTVALPFLRRSVPHPLLCSRLGVIDRFPDHMHEGEVVADDDVQLDLPLDIPGYELPEYPFVIPEVLASGPLDDAAINQRPAPRVIAYGRTTNKFEPEVVLSAIAEIDLSIFYKRFGVVSVYDGDRVGLGRVVVDSTWHHWFSLNLDGIATDDATAFQKMRAYYRNVAMWLAAPEQRASMLVSGTWGVLNGLAPMAFSMESGPWEVGERVVSALALTVSPCGLGELVAPFLDLTALAASSVESDEPQYEPSWGSLPEDLVHRAIVGGIGSSLLGLAVRDQEQRARGRRTRLDAEEIRRRAVEGAARGRALLAESLESAAHSIAGISSMTEAAFRRPPVDVAIRIDVRKLRIVAERLQLPDRTDPVLLDRTLTMTVRVKLDETVLGYQIIEDVELPAFDERGGIIDLNREIVEIEVQSGETFTVEVLAGRWTGGAVRPDAIRFRDSLHGDISAWPGHMEPSRTQAWRLWYSIESESKSVQ